MEKKDLSSTDLNEVVETLVDRCASPQQLGRAVALLVVDRSEYSACTWHRHRREFEELLNAA